MGLGLAWAWAGVGGCVCPKAQCPRTWPSNVQRAPLCPRWRTVGNSVGQATAEGAPWGRGQKFFVYLKSSSNFRPL